MKGSMLWRLMYLFCALAGCLAGYGIFTLTSSDEIKPNTITKDNTLVRESGDSVFSDGRKEETETPLAAVMPTVTTAPVVTKQPVVTPTPVKSEEPEATPIPEYVAPPVAMPEEPGNMAEDKPEEVPDTMPSLASQWANAGLLMPTPIPTLVPTPVGEAIQNPVTETLTYPAEIFGQVPVLNRSDTYVSYFEFAYDLIAMMEPEVKARGLNMNSLLAKFVIKALFCGVDIEKLDINAPIPRRLAALCLWLAAQVLDEAGYDTSAKSAQNYVVDISGCSSAEKKAIAYLYEQGILEGYQTEGQKFFPDAGLKTESGATWLSGVKQCWK